LHALRRRHLHRQPVATGRHIELPRDSCESVTLLEQHSIAGFVLAFAICEG
jgi:hypothetical protein